MDIGTASGDSNKSPVWPWRTALVVNQGTVAGEIRKVLAELNAECVFETEAAAPSFEIANLVERERPDILFAQMTCIAEAGPAWIEAARSGGDTPLVVAVHTEPDPKAMIDALRAGASEFLSAPVRPAIFEAMDRLATVLESRRAQLKEQGRMSGVISAKGGCGATTIACHLAAHVAAQMAGSGSAGKVLMADLDAQSAGAHRIFRVPPRGAAGSAFEAVRRLNAACWPDFVTPAAAGVDLLGGDAVAAAELQPTEPWRIESLFRFLARHYGWVFADLGRHVNPSNWNFLGGLDELFVVTAPDVLALYQTRAILQTFSSRGVEKGKLRLILNRNRPGPQDFWVESIEQMFEMNVISIIPDDAALAALPRDRYEFPAASPFGRAVGKLAARLMKPAAPAGNRKAAGKAA